MRPPRLHLAIPGLLGPWPEGTVLPPDLRLPALETLLARARRAPFPGQDPQTLLFRLFGLETATPPVAAVSRLGEGLPARDDYWLHADPVYLRPDMDRILLFDNRSLDIREEESAALLALLNDHFADRGWRLEAASPGRWYLHLADDPGIETSPLHSVAGRSLFPFLPRGENARSWHGLLNEAQMLLFHAPVNRQRRKAGRPEIGGLWPWGGGTLPRKAPRRWDAVLGRGPLLSGLCRLSDSPDPAPAAPRALDAPAADTLVVRDEPWPPLVDHDPAAWARELAGLTPLLDAARNALRSGHIASLLLYPGTGHSLEVTRGGLRRFWRRRHPFASHLRRNPPP